MSARLFAKYPLDESGGEDEQCADAFWGEFCGERLPLKFHDEIWDAYLNIMDHAARMRRALAEAELKAQEEDQAE